MCEIFVDLTCLNQTLLYGAILILTDFFVILHCNWILTLLQFAIGNNYKMYCRQIQVSDLG